MLSAEATIRLELARELIRAIEMPIKDVAETVVAMYETIFKGVTVEAPDPEEVGAFSAEYREAPPERDAGG